MTPKKVVGIDVGMGREEADALDDALREIRQSAWRLVQPEARKKGAGDKVAVTPLTLKDSRKHTWHSVVPQENLRDISVQVQA